MRAFHQNKSSPLSVLAACLVVALIVVAVMQASSGMRAKRAVTSYTAPETTPPAPAPSASWQQEMMLLGMATTTGAGEDDGRDPIAMITPHVLAQLIGEYNGLKASGQYSDTAAERAAADIAPNVYAAVAYDAYVAKDIKTDPDASYERMLAYRADMQTALKPLLDNKEAEYALFGSYVATGDASYLRKLDTAAQNYSLAASAAAKVVVPADILSTHLAIVNALTQFSATLNKMTAHADDPIASLALLRTYNDAESAVVESFDKLARYERLKQL